ncbi:MAG: ribitol-5-phosphate dehydrogenase [Epulopiscium sp. Nuni2H_MBin001]|nr:MAG: ribitol-5-phosphate dehydrogenase [Epulopiscium sp. Nuni2H_MBin001]
MINKRYRLIGKGNIKETFIEENVSTENILVRPTYLSICASDQRYYNFDRPPDVLQKKLPMALIHEAMGTVVYDPLQHVAVGQNVILVPLLQNVDDKIVAENYKTENFFRSSGYDGFLQDIVSQPRDRAVIIPNGLANETLAFTELMSVAVHSIKRFLAKSHSNRGILGIWGDGNLGFILTLLLKKMCPDSRVVVFGLTREKLNLFTFADDICLVSEVGNIRVDHAFECVGGNGSKYALNQIIDIINPEGCISLLGVSEDPPSVNTRLILEKGLLLVGNSRSSLSDYFTVLDLLRCNHDIIGYLQCLVSSVCRIRCVADIHFAFASDLTKEFGKTILKWEI